MHDIRDNLKAAIEDKGYIKTVIAKKANLTPSKLSSILSKNRKLYTLEMFSLCEVLEITPEELRNYERVS